MTRASVTPVRAVLLDVNETLVDLRGLEPAFAEIGLAGALPLWFARTLRTGFALAATGDYRTFGEVAASALIELDPERLGDREAADVLAAFAELRPHPDVAAGLGLLDEAGIPAMTLSVGDATVVEGIFARAGLDHLLAGHLSVDAVRRWKPAPEPYLHGCERLGNPPDEVAMIAAHSWDLHGARQVGMQTGWVSRLEQHRPRVFPAPDVAAPDLPGVVRGLLERSGRMA